MKQPVEYNRSAITNLKYCYHYCPDHFNSACWTDGSLELENADCDDDNDNDNDNDDKDFKIEILNEQQAEARSVSWVIHSSQG